MVDIGGFKESRLVLIYSITPVHAGTGRGGGVVDLPVQRDLQGFPIIFSSSLKGPLKSFVLSKANNERKIIEYLMGPELEGETETFSSSFAVLDAKLLAIPARSLKGIYVYVTSPFLLSELQNYCEITNKKELADLIKKITECMEKSSAGALASKNTADKILFEINNAKQAVINEDYWLKINICEEVSRLEECLGQEIEDVRQRGLLVVSDEYIGEIVEKSLMRITRIRIDSKTKTVKTRGLWTEEYIPNKTIFSTVFLYSDPRVADGKLEEIKSECIKDATKVRECIERYVFSKNGKIGFLVIGGNETIGRGIVKLIAI
ncbi:MAG: type III-B CRISPR module RAMP protein Cmr4 [Thermoprotei archaeon]|nr:MAG: type III-B CRISPR module RAMP protein Cmr4 [Thermoprotei archaeon]